MEPIEAYPLAWPVGRPRSKKKSVDRFDVSFARARDAAAYEVRLLGGKSLVISSNVPLKQNGMPSANFNTPDDNGVAVYFEYKGKQMCFACDRWSRVTANMQAIAKTIEALRGISRWGTGDMMEAAFTGFAALPAPGNTTFGWRHILEVDPTESRYEFVEQSYKRLRSQAHPDRGGNVERFSAIQNAWDMAQQELRQ